MGICYYRTGQFEKADNSLNKGLKLTIRINGEEHEDTAAFLVNFASMVSERGDLRKASNYLERAVDIMQNSSKYANGPEIAIVFNNLAVTYKNQGDYYKSLSYYEKSIIGIEKSFGKQHTVVAEILNNFASLLRDMKEFDQALEYYNRAIDIYKAKLKKETRQSAIVYANIGGLYYKRKEYNKALEYFNKSYEIVSNLFGDNHIH